MNFSAGSIFLCSVPYRSLFANVCWVVGAKRRVRRSVNSSHDRTYSPYSSHHLPASPFSCPFVRAGHWPHGICDAARMRAQSCAKSSGSSCGFPLYSGSGSVNPPKLVIPGVSTAGVDTMDRVAWVHCVHLNNRPRVSLGVSVHPKQR